MTTPARTNKHDQDERLLDYLQSLSTAGLKPLGRYGLDVKGTHCTTEGQVMEEFLKFTGEGWLHTAESATIHLLPTVLEKTVKTTLANQWPIAGERCSSDPDRRESLHIRRVADGWIVSRLSRAEHEEAVLIESRLLAEPRYLPNEEARRWLCYEVSHEPPPAAVRADGANEGRAGSVVGIAPVRELRPAQFRFIGFDPPLRSRPAQL